MCFSLKIIITLMSTFSFCVFPTLSSNCFWSILREFQSCKNNHFHYATIQGIPSQGFGSEFNYNLIFHLINAIMLKQRLIFVKPLEQWEYDCPGNKGWACYFKFPCDDSVIHSNLINITNEKSSLSQREAEIRDFDTIIIKLQNIYKELHKNDKIKVLCDISKLTPTSLTSIAANYLYQLNSRTIHFIKSFNSFYNNNFYLSKYIALQIRSTDKISEMNSIAWSRLHNVTYLVSAVSPYFTTPYNITNLYISTDNCQLVVDISEQLATSTTKINLFSPCLNHTRSTASLHLTQTQDHNYTSDGKYTDVIDYSELVGHFNPRRSTYQSTMRLLAEIETMRAADHFFGIMNSNLVRMVTRLRYRTDEQLDRCHPLVQEVTDEEKQFQLIGLIH